jgi:MFS family permease
MHRSFSNWVAKTGLNGLAYFAFAGLSSFNIGAYLVLVSWTAVEVTGDARLVSGLFLLSLIMGLIVANIAGVLSETRHVRPTLIWANLVRLVAGIVIVVALTQGLLIEAALYAFIILRTVGNAFIMTSGSVVFQETFPTANRPSRVAEIGILQQAGIALGTGVAGLLIAYSGSIATAMLLAIVALVQTPLIWLFTRPSSISVQIGDEDSSKSSFMRKWLDGLSYVRRSPTILFPMIVLSATYSIAQLTNIMVPIFVQNDLGEGADTYGTMEMLWAAGGSIILFLVRSFRPQGLSTPTSLVLLGSTGIIMIAFALTRDVVLSMGFYFVLGALFSITRLVSDSQIMTLTETEYVGRVRAANLMLTNGIGIVIFALPWLVETAYVTSIYVGWGSCLFGIAMSLYLLTKLSARARAHSS